MTTSLSAVRANIVAVPFMLPGAFMAIPFLSNRVYSAAVLDQPYLMLVALLGLIIVHEGVHGIVWKIASGLPWACFRFGVNWRVLAPYAHATEPMRASAYRIGAVAPFVALGVLPWLLGIVVDSAEMMFVGVMGALSAAGDLLIIWLVRKVAADALLADHPSQLGCILVERAP